MSGYYWANSWLLKWVLSRDFFSQLNLLIEGCLNRLSKFSDNGVEMKLRKSVEESVVKRRGASVARRWAADDDARARTRPVRGEGRCTECGRFPRVCGTRPARQMFLSPQYVAAGVDWTGANKERVPLDLLIRSASHGRVPIRLCQCWSFGIHELQVCCYMCYSRFLFLTLFLFVLFLLITLICWLHWLRCYSY